MLKTVEDVNVVAIKFRLENIMEAGFYEKVGERSLPKFLSGRKIYTRNIYMYIRSNTL